MVVLIFFLSPFSSEYIWLSGFDEKSLVASLPNLAMNNKVTKRGEMNEAALFVQEKTLLIIDFITG